MAALTFDPHGALPPLRAAGFDLAPAGALTQPIGPARAADFPIR